MKEKLEKMRNTNFTIGIENYRYNRAITLISLVITIILLLILLGIIVSLTLGENGIFNKAKYAKEKYLNAEEEEKQKINELYSQMLIATNDSSEITVNIKQLIDIIHPVGSIYISTTETNPSELFGGEWESYGEGRTLVGAGNGYEVGRTGGNATVKLEENNLPNHNHSIPSLTGTASYVNLTGTFTSRAWKNSWANGVFSISRTWRYR